MIPALPRSLAYMIDWVDCTPTASRLGLPSNLDQQLSGPNWNTHQTEGGHISGAATSINDNRIKNTQDFPDTCHPDGLNVVPIIMYIVLCHLPRFRTLSPSNGEQQFYYERAYGFQYLPRQHSPRNFTHDEQYLHEPSQNHM